MERLDYPLGSLLASAQLRATAHPTNVQPSRKSRAKIAIRFGRCLRTAMTVGSKYRYRPSCKKKYANIDCPMLSKRFDSGETVENAPAAKNSSHIKALTML